MSEKVILVAESLEQWEKLQNNEVNDQPQQLNEGAKGLLKRFIANPAKKNRLISAFAKQLGRTRGLKEVLLKLDDEKQLTLAKQALAALEQDPKKGYPWLQIRDNRIIGANALGVQSKPGIYKASGTD